MNAFGYLAEGLRLLPGRDFAGGPLIAPLSMAAAFGMGAVHWLVGDAMDGFAALIFAFMLQNLILAPFELAVYRRVVTGRPLEYPFAGAPRAQLPAFALVSMVLIGLVALVFCFALWALTGLERRSSGFEASTALIAGVAIGVVGWFYLRAGLILPTVAVGAARPVGLGWSLTRGRVGLLFNLIVLPYLISTPVLLILGATAAGMGNAFSPAFGWAVNGVAVGVMAIYRALVVGMACRQALLEINARARRG